MSSGHRTGEGRRASSSLSESTIALQYLVDSMTPKNSPAMKRTSGGMQSPKRQQKKNSFDSQDELYEGSRSQMWMENGRNDSVTLFSEEDVDEMSEREGRLTSVYNSPAAPWVTSPTDDDTFDGDIIVVENMMSTAV